MKHGLKQEIKRGLSVLMAVSMVASSALPVMAEEVVEEAVEVEVVSEDVADEAGDVVVDIAAEDVVVDEVVDGEVVDNDTVVGEAADDTVNCLHPNVSYVVDWTTNGVLNNVIDIKTVCQNPTCDGKVALPADITISEITPTKFIETVDNTKWKSNMAIISEQTAVASGCGGATTEYKLYQRKAVEDKPETYTYKVIDTATITTAGNHDWDGPNNDQPKKLMAGTEKATCTKDGTIKVYCYKEKDYVELTYDKWSKLNLPTDDDAVKAATVKGHEFVIDENNLTWSSDYKKVLLTAKCKNCDLTVKDIDLSASIKQKKGSGSWETVSMSKNDSCITGQTVAYGIGLGTAANELPSVINAYGKITYPSRTPEITTKVTKGFVDGSNNPKILKSITFDSLVPAVEGKNKVHFGWMINSSNNYEIDSETELPIAYAWVECKTCKTNHVFKSNKANVAFTNTSDVADVKNIANNTKTHKVSNVKVVVTKESEKKATCMEAGEAVYSVKLVLGQNEYVAESYENASSVSGKIAITTSAGSGHHTLPALTNANAYEDAAGAKVLPKDKYATCYKESEGYFYCSTCKNYIKRTIPVVAHTFTLKAVDPSTLGQCASPVEYSASCDVCHGTFGKALYYSDAVQDSNYVGTAYKGRAKYYSNLSTANKEEAANNAAMVKEYNELAKQAKAQLTDASKVGHNYVVDEKKVPTVWSTDYSQAIVTFTCDNIGHNSDVANEGKLHVKDDPNTADGHTAGTHRVTVVPTRVVDVKPGYDTKGKAHYEAVAKFTDCQGKEWSFTAVSKTLDIPATGEKETATISVADKTVTYNGNRQYVIPTKTSDAVAVVSYYKDKACTQKFSGAPYTAGTYYVKATVAETDKYTAAESGVATLVIKKADPKVTVTPATKTVKNTKKNTINIKVTQNNIGAQQGKVTYKAASSKIKVNDKGVVTVKKGTKKGTYKVTVTVKATTNYNKYTKTVKITVK